MAQLHITHAGKTTTLDLTGAVGTEYTIGREEGNSVSLPEAQDLSSAHCRVIKTEDGYVIQDNQSTNGVMFGDRKVDYELMLPGETYMAATVEIMLVETEAPAPTAPKKIKKKKSAHVAKKSPLGAPQMDIAALAEQYKRNQGLSGADIAYIVIVLVAALYAGMALYSWQHDGNPLPIFFR